MRRFLYITPSFPPLSKVGALRPLKFVRHLPSFGWDPIVLADLAPSDPVDDEIVRHVPSGVSVSRTYGRQTAATAAQFAAHGSEGHRAALERHTPVGDALRRVLPRALRNDDHSPSFFWPSQAVLPLGHYALEIPHATEAALQLVRQNAPEAIVVNSEPHAALLVGARVARATGLPLICDLRDPWSVCELKRPRRPALSRWWVDRIERRLVEQSARFIVNTETTLADYRAHYPDIDPLRFACIRNHSDPGLISHGSWPRGDRFRMVFLGNFRPFVEGDILLDALALLPSLGVPMGSIELVVTGAVPTSTRKRARELGLDEQLVKHPFVPYPEVGTFMQTADLLISLNNRTRQRVPAKFYDYLVSDRPLLVIADNEELQAMANAAGGATYCGLDDVQGVAQTIANEFRAGRDRHVARQDLGQTSHAASQKLAAILDDVVGLH